MCPIVPLHPADERSLAGACRVICPWSGNISSSHSTRRRGLLSQCTSEFTTQLGLAPLPPGARCRYHTSSQLFHQFFTATQRMFSGSIFRSKLNSWVRNWRLFAVVLTQLSVDLSFYLCIYHSFTILANQSIHCMPYDFPCFGLSSYHPFPRMFYPNPIHFQTRPNGIYKPFFVIPTQVFTPSSELPQCLVVSTNSFYLSKKNLYIRKYIYIYIYI